MIAPVTFQNDASFFCGLGVDGLDGALAEVGCGTMFDGDFATLGGHTAAGPSEASTDGRGVAVEVARTGLAGDDSALLVGGSGVDTLGGTLGDTQADAVGTGCNAVEEAAVDAGLGCSTSSIRDNAPATGLACVCR